MTGANPVQMDWLEALAAERDAGRRCVLITVADSAGSAPRERGAKMLVRADATIVGSVGGGHLEHRARELAAAMIAGGERTPRLERLALGPQLGQCCGGHVALLLEPFAGAELAIALFGAGHVGRAFVAATAGLPMRLIWIDSRAEEFPDALPAGVERLVAERPEDEVADLPAGTHALVMTHRHDLDLAIVERLLRRPGIASVGVIGSRSKRARFLARLRERGFADDVLARLRCPIGVPGLKAKHPRAIAIAAAAEILVLHANQAASAEAADRQTESASA